MSGARGSYHDGYANLAAAIIASGIRNHDTRFLESDWCELLRDICELDDLLYGDRSMSARGNSVVLTNRGGNKGEFN